MSVSHRVRGVKVLKAVSSTIRLQILNLLFDRGPLSYTELMGALKMNPGRDAGRFAYHLKFLLKADLVEADVEARKYVLTDLGKMVIEVADKVEQKAFKPKGLLVRTSRSSLEEFDANKIADSLMREAKMPAELAQKVAKEAEKQLLKSKAKYLTAPLVREIVNAILIDKGLEEHRHKLTRLGLPVHEVSSLLEAKCKALQGSASVVDAAGEAVLKEYTLLNVFPRDVADAHLSGALHVHGLSHWILKPNQMMHDLRFFMHDHQKQGKASVSQTCVLPPQGFESALALVKNVLQCSASEVCEGQGFDYFNVFLAPFAKDVEATKIKEALRLFIADACRYANVSLGLELVVPEFVARSPAFGVSGKVMGKYGDFVEEAQTVASLMLDVLAELSAQRPLFNPTVIMKVRPEAFSDSRAEAVLLKANSLASEKGMPYFASLASMDRKQATFSALGCCLSSDQSGDWEIDTLRAGCLGCVSISLPRVAYECEKDKVRFFEVLRERLEMAGRALEIKSRALEQRGRGLLPFLLQDADGDRYLRLESCSWIINIVGVSEAVEAFCGKSPHTEEEALQFAEEVTQTIQTFTQKTGKRRGRRLLPAVLPCLEASERLALADVERFGVGKVRFSGMRERPYYSSLGRMRLESGGLVSACVQADAKLRGLRAGGSLCAIDLGESEHKPGDLLALTKQLVQDNVLDLFTYDRKMTCCVNCGESWLGLLHKCPSCGAVGSLRFFDRFSPQ